MRKLILSLLIALIGITSGIQAQEGLPIGTWRVHLPYRNAQHVTGSASYIWCASDYGLFRFSKNDNSVERLSKVEGLSDLSIGTIGYEPQRDILLIGYKSGNIDIIQGNRIINMPDIRRAQIIGNKAINNVYFYNNRAYLSCGFGIVVLDIDRLEVKDTYLIGNNGTNREILDITIDGTRIYAATAVGVSTAFLNDPFLSNFSNWTAVSGLAAVPHNTIAFFGGKILVNRPNPALFFSDTIYTIDPLTLAVDTMPGFGGRTLIKDMEVYGNELYMGEAYGVFVLNTAFTKLTTYFTTGFSGLTPNDIFIDERNLWIADDQYGLLEAFNEFNAQSIFPNGPASINTFAMASSGNELLIVPGGRDDAWNNVDNRDGVSLFKQGSWTAYDRFTMPQLGDTGVDFLSCAIDPDDPNHLFVGSWGGGLVEIRNGVLTARYNFTNSPLESRPAYPWCGIGGLAYDDEKNLWIVNARVPKCLKMRKPNGQWFSFDFTGLVPGETVVSSLIVTQAGQKWMILPRGGGMLVFDDKGTLTTPGDDGKRKLGFSEGIGDIPGSEVLCMAEDKDGEIWIGTDDGIAVFYTPDNIFNATGFDCQRILIPQGSSAQELLAGQEVTAIAVDGANRKWVGVRGGGVFLLSADGTQQIFNFTAENSPLLSNEITAISINQTTGEVFFATDLGLVSYGGTAVEGGDKNEDVYAFPNPVRPDYSGPVAIRGLVKDADVKITDIRGNVVFTTKALGGQAVWDGNTFAGNRAATGVYLVFISNEDGTETAITKILFVN